MKSIEYSYFDRKKTDKITDFQNTSKIWNVIDDRTYGRCVQTTPTIEMIQFGIRRLELRFHTSLILLFHTLGVFKTSRSAKTSIEAKFGSYIRLDLEHQVYDLLDIEGEPCNTGEINIRKIKNAFKMQVTVWLQSTWMDMYVNQAVVCNFRLWIWEGPMYR